MHDVTKSCTQNARPLNFNASEYKKFIDMASYSTLQLAFMKISLVEFWCSI